MRRRAKRYVYRFFIDREIVDASYFWCYPLCFAPWASIEKDGDGKISFPQFSMYPADAANPKWDLTAWEVFNCPWYLDSDQWSIAFDRSEKSSYAKILKGEEPKYILSEIKFGPTEKEERACLLMEEVCQRQGVNVDRTQKSKGKATVTKADSQKNTMSQQSLRPSKFCWRSSLSKNVSSIFGVKNILLMFLVLQEENIL